ncbi:MAG TPA: hypothetical protein VIN08_19960 [Ohtaekwangia sp.]|uniref:hypothetical protein n=1 Tax=Ohtaekwangia sp. TaxID=2066019 RepID=UPI002F95456D
MKKPFILVLIALIVFVLLAIYQKNVGYIRFGRSFNDTRRELGVPLIEESFQTSDYLFWYNESRSYPRHAMKLLTTSWFGLEIEQDNFQFVEDSVVVTAYCYYHYEEKCYNIYLSQDGVEREISCKKLLELLGEHGLTVKINCKECSNIK